MILSDLMTDAGLAQLIRITGGTQSYYNHPERAEAVAEVVRDAITRNPNLAHIKVRLMPNLPNAFYNYERGEIILGVVNPDALAHELGHADNLQQEGLYRKILSAASGVARINNVVALPAMLALHLFVQDPTRRDDILKSLAAVSAAVAAPGLLEELTASGRALWHSPNKLQTAGTLAPAFMAHMTSSMMPSMIYQAGRP
jgi:hypothetical protein